MTSSFFHFFFLSCIDYHEKSLVTNQYTLLFPYILLKNIQLSFFRWDGNGNGKREVKGKNQKGVAVGKPLPLGNLDKGGMGQLD